MSTDRSIPMQRDPIVGSILDCFFEKIEEHPDVDDEVVQRLRKLADKGTLREGKALEQALRDHGGTK
jgi:hypothetical protein